jgi:O-antigen/teichoic acid export membrane protein
VPEYVATKDYSKLNGVILKSNKWAMIASITFCIFSVISIYSLKINELLIFPFILAIASMPFNVLSALRQATLRAINKIGYALIPDFIVKPALLLFFLLVFMLFNFKATALNILAVGLLTSIIVYLTGNEWQKNILIKLTKKQKAAYDSHVWIKITFPLFLIVGLGLISIRIDIAMLSVINGTENIGIYSAASRISEIMVFCLASTNTFVVPTIARLYSQKKINRLEKFLKKITRLIIFLSIPFLCLLLFFGKKFLLFFGHGFDSGYLVMIILILGQSSSLIFGPNGPLLMMTGYQKSALKLTGLSAALNVILNIILIPKYGILGASISTSTSLFILNMLMYITVKNKLKINSAII